MAAPISNREYDVGDVMRTTVTIKVSGVLTDPSSLVFKFKTSAGVITTKTYGVDSEVVRDSTGVFHCDVTLSASGTWHYRWQSSGTGAGAVERRVLVRGSEFD